MTLTSAVFVGTGSAVGAVARYFIGVGVAKVNNSPFPWGTWLVNMIGTFLLGIFTQMFNVLHHNPDWWLVLGEGFCGGFTTFSTMSVETVNLFRTGRMLGVIYLGSSLAMGLVFAWIAKWWF
ncbi:MAG: fluoride efflux transporter CrcB [Alicyclobacillus sp.]|nr:fluoride efflux transporter CrcB [Alicyclobacillus sp.]